ncbi:MAG: Ger(x)C family spore germination protein [Clostridia bacterium]|nr:Ger(x)C family spore germination protein [Clostridia bacterium]
MKKLNLILLLLLIPFVFSSCDATADKEIKNRLIIEGVGIDYDSESKEYILTVQVLEASKSGEEGGQSAPVVNYTVTGKTVASALNSLWENTGRYPLYSQNRIIVIGSSLNGDNITRALDFFVREYTARADVTVAAATGSAADVMMIQNGGEIPAKLIENSIREGNENSAAVDTELYNVVNLSMEKTTSFTLPLLEIVKDRNADGEAVKVTGTYCYMKNGKKNHLSDMETMMYKFITDDVELGTMSMSADGVAIGLDIISSSTDVKTELRDNKPHFSIEIKCAVDILEYGNVDFLNIDDETVNRICLQTQDYIESCTTQLLHRQLKEEKCDIFRFFRHLLLKYPEVYNQLATDYENALSEFSYDVQAKVTVRKIGQESMVNR